MKAEHLDEQPSITNTDDKVLSKLSQHWLKIIEGIADTKGGQEALDNYIEYTTAIKTLLANKIKEAELRGRIDEINRWFDMPKRYKGEEYRDEPFAKVKCKTPGRTQYYTLDSRFNWALADRLETLAALERSDPTHQPQTIQGRRNQ